MSSNPKPSRSRKGAALQNSMPSGTIPPGDETKGPADETVATATANDEQGEGDGASDQILPGPAGGDIEPTADETQGELLIQDLRKRLSDKYPHANAKEVIEQMQVKLARFPRRVQDAPRRKVDINVSMTVETVAWFHELMSHAWPSRRSRK